MQLELTFPIAGQTVPTDHGYSLYSALSREWPWLHTAEATTTAIGPIAGVYTGQGNLAIDPKKSRLRIRIAEEHISKAIVLAGKRLEVNSHVIRLGAPSLRTLTPATVLVARTVTIKHHLEAASFLDAVRKELHELQIVCEAAIPLSTSGPTPGRLRRRVLRIKDKRVVGFSLLLEGLSANDSIRLQEIGLGGRRKMGCGFFLPWRG